MNPGPAAARGSTVRAMCRGLLRLWPLFVIALAALALSMYSNMLALAIIGVLVFVLASPLGRRR